MNHIKYALTPLAALIITSCVLLCTSCEPEPYAVPRAPDTGLFILTSDYSTGSYSVIDADTLISYNDLGMGYVHSDAAARFFPEFPDRVYVMNKLGRDNVQLLSPADNYGITAEVSMGTSSNPHDIAITDADNAYVSRYGGSGLWIIDPDTCRFRDSIDLSAYADPSASGIPRMSALYHYTDAGHSVSRLFVSLQRLKSTWHPSAYSSVLVIDTDQASGTYNTVVQEIILEWGTEKATNPQSRFVFVPAALWQPSTPDGHDHLFISCVGEFGFFINLDCGIVAVDAEDLRCEEGYILSEATAGSEIMDFVIKSATRGYAVTSDASFNTSLISFNPQTGEVTSTIRTNGNNWGSLVSLALDSSGRLFLCDRNALKPGVRVYDTNNGDAPLHGNRPIYTGLPPVSVTVVE